ncbi:MAG: DUF1365 domain-containing protein [Stackebrandtia sp.]
MVSNWANTAAIYPALVAHNRTHPIRYRLRHRTYYWLVDVSDMPRPPWWLRPLAGFHARDHLGDHPDIRTNLVEYLRRNGEQAELGRIVMLCQARVFGYVFNPLTVYWCFDRRGEPVCVVSEVHNTYHGRHRYLLRPEPGGAYMTGKEFYVSPFMTVDGRYRMLLPLPDEDLRLSIVLEQSGRSMFGASVTGRRRPATTANLLRAALRYPFSTMATALAIRWHGVRLYLRGLPVVPRADPTGQKGSS